MVASMFGTNLQSDAVLFEGVIQVESFSRDGMSMGHHVPTGFPVLILRPALRLGRVTVYDFEIHSKDDLLIISASATAWWCRLSSCFARSCTST